MKFADLKRNKAGVLKHLKIQEDKSALAAKEMRIYIPERWVGSPLADLDRERIYIFGLFILVVENQYTLFNGCGMFGIDPSTYQEIEMDEVKCIEFRFNAGATVFTNLNIVQTNTLPREITNFAVNVGGKIPYLTKDDFLQIPNTFGSFAGLTPPDLALVTTLFQHVIRNTKDKRTLARHKPKDAPSTFIAFRNVALAAPDTYSKLSGSYEEEGLNDALVHPTDTPNRAEKVLRA